MKYADQFAATSRSLTVRPALRRRAGFTLIELLVAVTVLVVITLLLARIISQSNIVISEGTRQATQNASARMALDFLAREFAQAGADERIKFQRNRTPGSPATSATYGASGTNYPCHELRFVSFRNILYPGETGQPREGLRVAYYVKTDNGTNSLMRAEQAIAYNAYNNVWQGFNLAGANEAELIRYVVEFRVVCHDTNATATVMDDSEQDRLPAYIDVYLSTLSEVEAKRAKSFSDGSADQLAYINRNAKRYHTRCWSLNRTAYIRGR